MLAFDIYLNNNFICRAGLKDYHALSFILFSVQMPPSMLHTQMSVEGNAFPILYELPQSTIQNTKDAIEKVLKDPDKKLKRWIRQDLSNEFKIKVKIVDAEPSTFSEGENYILSDEKLSTLVKKHFN